MDPDLQLARKMAALSELGFRQVPATSLPNQAFPVQGRRQKVTCNQVSMGTLVSVTAVHESKDLIEEAAALAFEDMGRVVSLLSRFESSSALSFLNEEGSIDSPPPELWAVMQEARFYYEASRGAFDPTVKPLVDLFRQDAGESQVLQALALVDGRKMTVGPGRISLGIPGMGVTLDGIAKGYVVDRMAAVLNGLGLESFLINAGGDIRTAGVREDGLPWRVGVQDPWKGGNLPDVVGLADKAVATSGSYEIYFDRDRTYHHIVSSRDGSSPQMSRSVSVIAPTTLAADALATSVFVMEPRRGIAFVESFPQCACLIVDQDGRSLRSKGWRSAAEFPKRAGVT